MQILPLAAFYMRMSIRVLLNQETFIKMDQICCPVCHRWALVLLHKGEICIRGRSMLAAPVCVFSLLQSSLTVTDLIRRRRNRLLWWRPICLSLRCLCVLQVHRSDSWCLDLSSLRILCHIFGRPVKKIIITTKVHVLLFLFFTLCFYLYVYLLLQWSGQQQLFHLWQKVRGQVEAVLDAVVFQGRRVCLI